MINLPERSQFLGVDLLILEDEEDQLASLSKAAKRLGNTRVRSLRFGDRARDEILEGKVSVLVTDLKVKTHQERNYNATRILRDIKRRRLHVPSVATSAFDEIDNVRKERLAAVCISKNEKNSTARVTDAAETLVAQIHDMRVRMYDTLRLLRDALITTDNIQVGNNYKAARERVAGLRRSPNLPMDHRRGMCLLQTIVLHLSAVPSRRFALRRLTVKAYAQLSKLVQSLSEADFKYSKIGLEVADRLEALGFASRPRISLDDEKAS